MKYSHVFLVKILFAIVLLIFPALNSIAQTVFIQVVSDQ
jgi:hypothetical protein